MMSDLAGLKTDICIGKQLVSLLSISDNEFVFDNDEIKTWIAECDIHYTIKRFNNDAVEIKFETLENEAHFILRWMNDE